MKKYILFGILSLFYLQASAQDTIILMNSTNDSSTKRLCKGWFYDSGGENGNYARNEDLTITIRPNTSIVTEMSTFTFDTFDVNPLDTLYIYDGVNTSAPLLRVGPSQLPYANNTNTLQGLTITPSCTNTTGALTFRFKTSASVANPSTGWRAKMVCKNKCSDFTVNWDSTYYKVINGINVPALVKFNMEEYKIDSAAIREHRNDTIDTLFYNAIDVCHGVGDSLVLSVTASYGENSCFQYNPNWVYTWEFDNGRKDSTSGSQAGATFKDITCYQIYVNVRDPLTGCYTELDLETKVRVSKNPIKKIMSIPDLCTGGYYNLKVGYGAGSQIVMDTFTESKSGRATFTDTVFIPDGPNCPDRCYYTKVTFDQFPNGKTITSGDDICAVCFTAEHTFVGDLGLYLMCPTGKRATLMTYNGSATAPAGIPPNRPPYNGGADFGIPPTNRQVPGMPTPDACTQAYNKPGYGWQYCFSEKYRNSTQGYMGPRTSGNTRLDSTNYEAKTKFYLPDTAFSELIGCPLNGEWAIQVCDYWGADKGYVFNWFLEFCGDIQANSDCNYSVRIDSVIWQGPFVHNMTPTTAEIRPDSAGLFRYTVNILDNFGCSWDTSTNLTVVQTPKIQLGQKEMIVCSYNTEILLDCGVPDTNAFPNSYLWEPTGDTTRTLSIPNNLPYSTTYKVQVETRNANTSCRSMDSIVIKVLPTPTPSFVPDRFPLEGCQPLQVSFTSTSGSTDVYEWYFGDGTSSSEPNPVHNYPNPGVYDITLITKNNNGCIDTISYPGLIKVFSKPKAEFSWQPQNPSLLDPTIKFVNKTIPQNSENIYVWQIQDNLEDPQSYTYIFDSVNPYYSFPTDEGAEATGTYVINLMASTKNMPPSGYVYECIDTATHEITLLNDFLQFPNVITANGDGVNDVFRIASLAKGTAFPNNELHIYDRSGRTAYHKKNMTENDVWDPKAENAPAGTYFYKFVVKGLYKDNEFNGTIEVMR